MPRLISGGAHGADEWFEKCAFAKGHQVCVISFYEHTTNAKPENVVQFTHAALEENASRLAHVGNVIAKHVPAGGYTRWLLLRNITVAMKADVMFAVISATLSPPTDLFIGVPGGTGWTAQCFALEYLFNNHPQCPHQANVPLWVFDGTFRWHRLIYHTGVGFSWKTLETPPIIPKHSIYAGIGSREFSKIQRDAVESLFTV